MDLDTRHLRALVAVVDEGTFTDAAIELGMSQASVSRSIQRLERVVGARLLSRSTRHVEPSAAGLRVLPHARRILAALEQLRAAASGSAEHLVVGYAWSALGEHTVMVQRRWHAQTGGILTFVQVNTPTAGLAEGRCEISVVRQPVADRRVDCTRVAAERRYAVLAIDHPLARRPTVRLADLVDDAVAVDAETGTTKRTLWPTDAAPRRFETTHGVDEWLTLIASGRAVGISSEATAAQHPRPGIAYRPLDDADPIPVWLTWWRDSPPDRLATLLDIVREVYTAGQS